MVRCIDGPDAPAKARARDPSRRDPRSSLRGSRRTPGAAL